MTATDHQTEYSDGASSPAGGSGVRNGLIGGVVAVVLTAVPLSTLLGGAVAGYLDRQAGRDGVVAGAIAGVVAAVPYLLGGVYLAIGTDIAIPGPRVGAPPAVLIVAATVFMTVYAVGLSALGGVVGGCVHDRRTD